MAMKRVMTAACLLAVVAAGPAAARELQVVASFTVPADMVRQIGGEHVKVKSLVGPNGDPHVYEPTPSDADAIAKADLVVISGLGLEGWMERLIASAGTRAPVVVASTGIAVRTMTEDDDGPDKGKVVTDPHAWNSAANGAVYARNIEQALLAADPEDAAALKTQGDAYVARLQSLDAWAKNEIAEVPPAKRKVITSHDAFSYLGAAYGIAFLSPAGISSDAEPTARQVAQLIRQIKAEKIKTVFIENQTDPRLVTQIGRESGAKLGGELYPEALSEDGGPAATYADAFTYNIRTLKAGMLGK